MISRSAASVFVAMLVVGVAPARSGAGDSCAKGVFLPSASVSLRGGTLSHILITADTPPRLRVYWDTGGCEGVARFVRGRLKARVDRCLYDAGDGESAPRCCGPFVVRLGVPSCTELSGSIRSRGSRRRLGATQGRCGDGVVDTANGEQCDGDDRFFCAGLGCDPTCHCAAAERPSG